MRSVGSTFDKLLDFFQGIFEVLQTSSVEIFFLKMKQFADKLKFGQFKNR